MIIRTVRTSLILIVLLCSAVAFGQTTTPPANPVMLTVSGEVAHPLKLTAADLAKLPHRFGAGQRP